jgi:hypothetical protein
VRISGIKYSEYGKMLLTGALKSSSQLLCKHNVGILGYIVQIGRKTTYRVEVVQAQRCKVVQF